MAHPDFKSHLEELLLEEHSRARTEEIVQLIGGDLDKFAVAWYIFCTGEPPLPQRIAWVIDLVTAAHPALAAQYVGSFVARLPYLVHPAEMRAVTKVLARTILPKEVLGDVVVTLFPWVENPQIPIAVRVYAMQVLYNVSNIEPDLKRELAMVMEAQALEGGPGIRSRVKKLLPKLRKEIRDNEK
jgi:hypothetical protein